METARAALRARVLFRAWFHRTDDGIVVEHGHQYDADCAHRHPTVPFGHDGRTIQPTLGSLVARHLAARMGYFNPHVDGPYELSAVGDILHGARFYALTRRALIGAWAIDAVRGGCATIAPPSAADRPAGGGAAAGNVKRLGAP